MKKILGFLAVAGLLVVAAPSGPAQAASFADPGAAAAARATRGRSMRPGAEWRLA